jgi:hypothetical protein
MRGFSPSVYFLWGVALVSHAIACWAVVEKGFFKHWKAFGYYLFCIAGLNVALMGLALSGRTRFYAYSYEVGDFIEALLISLVVLEILVKVLAPFEALPGRTVARFCFWSVLGISLAVAVSVYVPGNHSSDLHVALSLTVERTIFLAGALILWIILLQAKALGITWKSSLAEIGIGFVLYLTVQATTRFVIGLYDDNPMVREIAAEVAQIAYLIALWTWIWTMTHREPVSDPDPEALERMRTIASGYDAVPKERIFAAVGIKVEESEEPGFDDAAEAMNTAKPRAASLARD